MQMHGEVRLRDELPCIAYLFVPLLGGALLEGVCRRYNWMPALATPIDQGATLRGRRVFGDSKTFRGLLCGALGTAMAMTLQARVLHNFPAARALEYADYSLIRPWQVGLLLGFVRMLSELPNSFAKRQLDIPPGHIASGGWAPVFYVFDYLDYLPGVWSVAAGFVRVTLRRVVLSAALVFVAHQLANLLGHALGLRRSVH